MAVELATAYISLVPSTKGLTASLQKEMGAPIQQQAEETSKKVGSTFKTMATAAAGAFAATAAVGFLKGAITGASDLNETVNKSNVIFGQNAGVIDSWAKGAARSVGLSRQQALEAASSFGDMFTQIGFSADAAAKMSTATVQMSADLGSFNNLPTADVQERISAALRGEYDSLQQVIPNINAARVEQEAMAATGKTNASALTAQEKAAAVLAIVHKDGSRAAGDFAKTSDGLANQQKILSAQFADVQAKVGTALLPIIVELTNLFSEHTKPILITIGVVAGVAFATWAVGAIAAAAATIAAAAPVLAIVAAIALVAAGVIYAYTHFQVFRTIVDALATAIKLELAIAIEYAKFIIGILVDYVQLIIRVVGDVVKGVSALFRGDWKGAWAAFGDIPKAAIEFIGGLLDRFIGLFSGIGKRIAAATGGMFDGIKDAFRAAINFVIRAWNGLDFQVPSVEVFGKKIGGFTLGAIDIPLLAAGGTATSGGLAIVGEAGPELLAMPTGATVAPLGGAGVGGAVYNINVAVGAGVHPGAVGEEIVRAIQAYEQGAGNDWRNNPARVGG